MATEVLLTQNELDEKLAELNAIAKAPWAIIDGKLHKRFDFKSFSIAMGFMVRAALSAEVLSHHPRWVNVYNVVEIDLLTHRAKGITRLDFLLATEMEKIAA
ncbi:MAG: 4a-hydroxytetrahydrobiopterin dehydratase [Porticoccaceae bacterium]